MSDDEKRYPWHNRSYKPPSPAESNSAEPVEFCRAYVPDDEEAKRLREHMLWQFDLGVERYQYSVLLAQQEARHQGQQLLKETFGDFGKDDFLLQIALDAYHGDTQAMNDWLEIAESVVKGLRTDGILQRMDRAVLAVEAVVKRSALNNKLRLIASLYALNYRRVQGIYPSKAAVVAFLKTQKNLTLPTDNNLSRLWKGAILGRLSNAKAGRKSAQKVARKYPSKKKIR